MSLLQVKSMFSKLGLVAVAPLLLVVAEEGRARGVDLYDNDASLVASTAHEEAFKQVEDHIKAATGVVVADESHGAAPGAGVSAPPAAPQAETDLFRRFTGVSHFSQPVRTVTSYDYPAAGTRGGYYGTGVAGARGAAYNNDDSSSGFGVLAHMVLGFFLFIFAFPLLYGNEKRQAVLYALFQRALELLCPDYTAESPAGTQQQKNTKDAGLLVHMKGDTVTNEELTDPEFKVRVKNCAKLQKTVEMLQWEYTEVDNKSASSSTSTTTQQLPPGENMNRPVEVRRELKWMGFLNADDPKDPQYRLTPAQKTAAKYFLNDAGADASIQGRPKDVFEVDHVFFRQGLKGKNFEVPDGLRSQMCNQKPLDPKTDLTASVPSLGAGSDRKRSVRVQNLQFAYDEGEKQWLCGSGAAMGDIRVRYTKTECGSCSLVAVVDASCTSFLPLLPGFQVDEVAVPKKVDLAKPPYEGVKNANALAEPLLNVSQRSRQGNAGNAAATPSGGAGIQQGVTTNVGGSPGCFKLIGTACSGISATVETAGASLFELAEPAKSASEMMEFAQNRQNAIHTALQVVGFLMLFFGLRFMLEVFPALLGVLPFVGGFLHLVGGFVVSVVSFLVAGILWAIIVAGAWFAVRPKYAMALVGAAVAVVVLANVFGKMNSG
ncbi:unnamed protein product [Amoebophrya sp. A120]|nr:unnamed protein product [Amoebophrya sp. A120]|eukprot:GSA120T00010348001.1